MPGFELIGREEKEAVIEVFEEGGILFAHGFDSLRKKYHVREFEAACEAYFKSKYCMALSSGTAGIKCALKALGVKPGDEVITQSFNFVGTVEAILDCGAKPKICSVDNDLHIDLEDLKLKITSKTKAIIIVHMLGMGGPLEELLNFCREKNICVLEDNCEAIGAKYKGDYLGTIGDIGVMSFDHGKMIACGEGGLVLTNKEKFANFVKQYTDHGHENNKNLPRGRDNRIMPGFNYRMTELQAAVGKVQLTKLNYMVEENKKRYSILFNGLNKFIPIRSELQNHLGSYDTFIISLKNKKKQKSIIEILNNLKFGTKNLPDAMEWHCSYFWSHALNKKEIANSLISYKYLKEKIAIPILLKKSIDDYKLLTESILNIVN